MRVAELQQFIRSLIPPLQASGAKSSVIDGLESASETLERYKELSVEAFATFLGRAEEYDRTGIVPVAAKAAGKPRATKEKTPAYTVEEALSELRSLHERSTSEEVSFAMIAEGVKKLDKLTAANLALVTTQFGLGKAKSKGLALIAIREKIDNFKKSHQRTQF